MKKVVWVIFQIVWFPFFLLGGFGELLNDLSNFVNDKLHDWWDLIY